MTPNMATGFGLFFAIVCAFFLYSGINLSHIYLWGVLPSLILRMGANALDGMLAREKNMADKKGEVLNEVTDVIGDLICYGSLVISTVTYPVGILFVVFLMLAEFTGLLSKAVLGVRSYLGPLGGKSDRVFWIGTGACLTALHPEWQNFANQYLLLVSFFVGLTFLNRFVNLFRQAALLDKK